MTIGMIKSKGRGMGMSKSKSIGMSRGGTSTRISGVGTSKRARV